MGDKAFEIRFDKHGNIIIDDPELQQRLKYVLELNGELVLRMKDLPRGYEVVLPEPIPLPYPYPKPRNPADCPMVMCDPCGKIRLVNDRAHEERWEGIGDGPGEP
jgi:hypothetical protein